MIECVPNFSEGRNPTVVDRIAGEIGSVPGAAILDCTQDYDHNRSVITFAGRPEAVAEAAIRSVGRAAALIDLNQHAGVHPRIGATDVVPFVPLEGATLQDCAKLAKQAAREIWTRFRIPVYLYGAAARRPDRVNLESIRRGQFEGLREAVRSNPDRWPDSGGPELHPTAGATAIGARRLLIAFNVNLTTNDVEVAKRIAKLIRFSSGGLPHVKALGLLLRSRNLAQVSMNLTDFEQMPLDRVFTAVCTEAERCGVGIAGSELVGLIPGKALEMAQGCDLRWENFSTDKVLENVLARTPVTE